MNYLVASSLREQVGVNRGVLCRYNEKKWVNRFKRTKSHYGKPPAIHAKVEYLPYCMECEMQVMSVIHPVHIVPSMARPETTAKLDNMVRMAMAADRLLAVVPTVLLAGAYSAIAFAGFSIGPAWAGFVSGALPVSALAAWAFAGHPRHG